MPSVYRFSQAVLVRLLGALLVALGLVLVLVTVAVLVWDLSTVVLTAAVVLVVVLVVVAGFALTRAAPLVRLEDEGYQVRLVRGAGVRQARWRDVQDVVTAPVSGHDCVVLRLKDGRTTTIPVAVLDADRAEFVRDLSEHLDRGHGYRRL